MSETPLIIDVDSAGFEAAVLERSRKLPVLVDFWAPWCGPCQTLMPVLERLAEEYAGQFVLAKVNIDEQQELAVQYGVRSVPTVKLFRHGEPVDEFLGAQPEPRIRAMVDRHIERASDRMLAEAETLRAAGNDEGALNLLQAAHDQEPLNPRLEFALADLLLAQGDFDRAGAILEGLPMDLRQEAKAHALAARLEFARAAAGPEPAEQLKGLCDGGDSAACYRLAAGQVVAGDYEAALENLMALLRRDRQWGDDGARKAILKIFDLLGGEGALVSRYRSRLFTALH